MKYLTILTAILISALLLSAACRAVDSATVDETAILQGYDVEESALLVRQSAGENVDAELERVRAERGELESSIAERAVGSVVDWIDAFVPIPLRPYRQQLSWLGAMLAFPRTRKHIARGIKALAKADFKGAGRAVLASTGLVHTNRNPLEVMRGAMAAARHEGDESTANDIQASINAILAKRAQGEADAAAAKLAYADA